MKKEYLGIKIDFINQTAAKSRLSNEGEHCVENVVVNSENAPNYDLSRICYKKGEISCPNHVLVHGLHFCKSADARCPE